MNQKQKQELCKVLEDRSQRLLSKLVASAGLWPDVVIGRPNRSHGYGGRSFHDPQTRQYGHYGGAKIPNGTLRSRMAAIERQYKRAQRVIDALQESWSKSILARIKQHNDQAIITQTKAREGLVELVEQLKVEVMFAENVAEAQAILAKMPSVKELLS